MIRLLITLLAGSAGGLAGMKLRLPAGPLIGSMLAVGIYNCLGFQAFIPPQARIGSQIIIGCILGLNLNRNTFMQLRSVIKPALVITVSLLICGLTIGFILFKFFGFDMYTAFLCSSAGGGVAELSILAASMGGDGPKVAVLHLIRMITVVAAVPMILHGVEKLFQKGKKKEPM